MKKDFYFSVDNDTIAVEPENNINIKIHNNTEKRKSPDYGTAGFIY